MTFNVFSLEYIKNACNTNFKIKISVMARPLGPLDLPLIRTKLFFLNSCSFFRRSPHFLFCFTAVSRIIGIIGIYIYIFLQLWLLPGPYDLGTTLGLLWQINISHEYTYIYMYNICIIWPKTHVNNGNNNNTHPSRAESFKLGQSC